MRAGCNNLTLRNAQTLMNRGRIGVRLQRKRGRTNNVGVPAVRPASVVVPFTPDIRVPVAEGGTAFNGDANSLLPQHQRFAGAVNDVLKLNGSGNPLDESRAVPRTSYDYSPPNRVGHRAAAAITHW